MNSRFTVELSSDLDYKEMVVYISLDEELVAILNCEKGIDKLELELFPLHTEKMVSISFEDYLHAFEFARKTLVQSQKKNN